MRAMPEGYQRKGKPIQIQMDFDAVEMLRELAPTRKGYGRYLSELIRRDFIRRQEWEQVRAGRAPELVDVGALGG